jgi:hypothetical protein
MPHAPFMENVVGLEMVWFGGILVYNLSIVVGGECNIGSLNLTS